MAEQGHTPGPWEIGEDDINGQAVVRAEHIEIATCWHHCVGSLEDEMRHNACLIAAAPELLAAAREGLICAEADLDDVRRLCVVYDEKPEDDQLYRVFLERRDLIAAAVTKAEGGAS